VPLLTERGLLFLGTEHETRQADDILAQGKERPAELRKINSAEALALVPFLKPAFAQIGVHYPDAKEIDVAALHQGWIRGLKKRGGEFLMKQPVTGIERRSGTWIVTTKSDSFETGMLVNAAGGWADAVAILAGLKPLGLIPKRRTIITIDTPPAIHSGHYPMVIYLDEKFYFKTEAGGLIASPMDAAPVAPHDVQPEELDIATAAWLLEERTTLPVPRIKSSWAGLRSFLPDEAPVAGRDPAADNFIWLAGQGGFGIKTCDALARCAVELALNGDIPADVKAQGIRREQLAAGREFLKAGGPSV
jgi:D-arginine dehydrogenase